MNALVVGYGHMGRIHARVLRDLGYAVRTVDPDPETWPNYATIAEARLDGTYDVAAIACPIEHLVDCAYQLAGTPMVVEKPFAPDERTAKMLAAYLKQAGAPVCVNFTERFNPQIRALKAMPIFIQEARFVRHSDRPSQDPDLDLLIHDVDLAAYLRMHTTTILPTFEVRTEQLEKLRRVELKHLDGELTVDLMDHTHSPLHALWHAFLVDKAYPTPQDAIFAHENLQIVRQQALCV